MRLSELKFRMCPKEGAQALWLWTTGRSLGGGADVGKNAVKSENWKKQKIEFSLGQSQKAASLDRLIIISQ
jgi:hypothetical protein